MKIVRVYNNNIIAANDDNQEVILTGIGIGFQKKTGDIVDENKIDKIYIFENKQHAQFNQLLQRTPILYFQIAEKIAIHASEILHITLSNQLLISLTDHHCYAAERKKRNIVMPNLMLNEIKLLYKEEYKIGLWALKIIQVNTNIVFDQNEASFIAMHIVNATLGNSASNTTKILRFIKDIQKTIEDSLHISFEDDTLDTSRILIHLKFLANHIFQNAEIKNPVNASDLYKMLIKSHENMKQCMENICSTVEKNYNYILNSDEQVYLMIHISRIIK